MLCLWSKRRCCALQLSQLRRDIKGRECSSTISLPKSRIGNWCKKRIDNARAYETNVHSLPDKQLLIWTYVKYQISLLSVKRLKIYNRCIHSHNWKMHFTKGNPFSNFKAVPKRTILDMESNQKKGFQSLQQLLYCN